VLKHVVLLVARSKISHLSEELSRFLAGQRQEIAELLHAGCLSASAR